MIQKVNRDICLLQARKISLEIVWRVQNILFCSLENNIPSKYDGYILNCICCRNIEKS